MPSLKAIANKVLVEKYGVTHLALNAIRFLLIRKKKTEGDARFKRLCIRFLEVIRC